MSSAPEQRPVQRRRWLTWSVVLAVAGVVCVLLGYGVQRVREAANRMDDL